MANAAAVKKSVATDDPPLRATPTIDPAWCKLNFSGAEFQNWFIRLPKGTIADDLKEPSLFKRVQQSGRSTLRKYDDVRLVDFEEKWFADATVAEANANEIVLTGIKIMQLPERTKPLFQDERFQVEWHGAGYVVMRKSDGAKLTNYFPTEQLAVAALGQQYAVRIS